MSVTRTAHRDAPEDAAAAGSAPAPNGREHDDETADDLCAATHPTWELWALLVLALVVGVVGRFVAPTPLWLDEALSVNIASLPVGEIADALRRDGHPPLYYVLLHGWMSVFGDGDTAVRALSGVFSLLALPLAWIIGRRRGGTVLAACFVIVLSLSPFVLRYATETRMYSMVMLLVLVGYLLLDDLVWRDRRAWWHVAALALLTAALLYTHYWAFWLVGAVFGLCGWSAWRSPRPEVRSGARRALVGLVAGGVLFVPWLPVLAYQGAHTGTPWASPPRPTTLVAVTFSDLGGIGFLDAQLTGGLMLLLALLGVFGRAVDARHIDVDLRTVRQLRAETVVIAGTILLGVLAGYATWSAFATRYAAVFIPLLLLLVAAGITRFAGRWPRAGVLAVVSLLSLSGLVWSVTHDRTQLGQLAEVVEARAEPGDVVVYCPDQLGPAGERVMRDDLEQLAFPSLGDPRFVDWVDYAERNEQTDPAAVAADVLARAGDDHAVFVVWNGSYKSFEGQCEAFVGALGLARGGAEQLATVDSATFENAALVRIPPAP